MPPFMIVDMAVEHPRSGHIGNHVGCDELCRPDSGQHVHVLSANAYQVAMPMWGVEVESVAHRHQIPADMLTFAHGHYRAITEHITVDRGVDVADRKTAAEPKIGVAGVFRDRLDAIELRGVCHMGAQV